MKHYLLFLILAGCILAMSSCLAPENTVHKAVTHENLTEYYLKDTSGVFHYKGFVNGKGEWLSKDSTWQVQAKRPLTDHFVSMSNKQVYKYIKLHNWNTNLTIGIVLILIVVAGWFFISASTWGKGSLMAILMGSVVLLAVGIRTIQKQPADAATNNTKRLTTDQYNYYLKKDSTFNYFWDSLYRENRILDLGGKPVKQ